MTEKPAKHLKNAVRVPSGKGEEEAFRYEKIAFYILVVFVFLIPTKFGTISYDLPPKEHAPFPNPVLPFDPWPDEFAQVILILVFLLWMLSMLARKQVVFKFSMASIPLWLFIAFGIISTFRSVVIHSSIVSLKAFMSYVLFFHLVVNLANSRRRIRTLIWSFVAACVFVGVLGVLQRLFLYEHMARQIYGSELADWEKYVNVMRIGRVSSTFVYPNALAGFIITAVPVLLAVILIRKDWLRRESLWKAVVYVAIAIVPISISFILSESKGGFIALGIVMLVGIFISARLFRLSWKIILPVLIAIFLIAAVLPFTPIGRILVEKGKYTFGERLEYWKAASGMVHLRPVLGSGFSSFDPMYNKYRSPEANDARAVHNNYLQLLVETGMLGLLSFIAFWIFVCIIAVRVFSRRKTSGGIPGFEVILTLAAFLGILGFLLHNFVDFDLYVRGVSYSAWFLAALVLVNSDWLKPHTWHVHKDAIVTVLLIAVTAASLGCVYLTIKTYRGGTLYFEAYQILSYPEEYPELLKPHAEAEQLLQKAIRWDGLNHGFYSTLGNLQLQRGEALGSEKDVRKSIETFERAISLNRHNTAHRLNLIRAEKELMNIQGQINEEKIRKLWKELLEYAPNVAYYRILYADQLRQFTKTQEALSQFTQALELDPGLERTLQKLQGKYNEAEFKENVEKLRRLQDG